MYISGMVIGFVISLINFRGDYLEKRFAASQHYTLMESYIR